MLRNIKILDGATKRLLSYRALSSSLSFNNNNNFNNIFIKNNESKLNRNQIHSDNIARFYSSTNNSNSNNTNTRGDQENKYERAKVKVVLDKPVIAIIGKPNVGKSTLFNRVIQGQRDALVEEIPGTTRDRYYGEGFLYGKEFMLVDTGGLIGETKNDRDQFQGVIKEQAEIAMEESDAILFVIDFKHGITPVDKELARMLRTKKAKGKPVFIGVNKADNIKNRVHEFDELKTQLVRLGLGDNPIPFSAIHGDGVLDLMQHVLKDFAYKDLTIHAEDLDTPGPIRAAIVGQPNAGKSSLLNKIIEEERSIVSDIPGTTHDPVDITFNWRDTHEMTLIDTAGIRRRSTHKVGLEKSSVLWALKAIERSHVVYLVIDATVGVTEQDLKIAGFAIESRKSLIVIVNKWDLYLSNLKSGKMLEDKLYFQDLQKQNSFDINQFNTTSMKKTQTFKSLLEDLIAENIEKSKTDNNLKPTSFKKKSSILEKKNQLKNKAKQQEVEKDQDDQDEDEDQDDEEDQENSIQANKQHSSDLQYSQIYWPDKQNNLKEIDNDDDDEFDIDIEQVMKQEQDQEEEEEEELDEEEEAERFYKNYLKYLKKKEEMEKEAEEKGTIKKRPPPPDVQPPKLSREQKDYEAKLREKLTFLDFVPVLFTSAKTGFCVPTAIDLGIKVFFEREKKLKVSTLMDIINQATFKHKLPSKGKNSLRIKFAAQVKGYPPTFVFFVNDPEKVEPSLVKYLLNSIRQTYPYTGTPIFIKFKKNKRNPKYSKYIKRKTHNKK
ncbi:hypothetical protein CYY_007099 [Polysphondylium violaceum]|uniref:GTPase Der n=1 Tax=Polysphondylium violaceum TaxID=133409 RepID=A0A8J4PP51_9MYCE|nr:hypothetical protein CYY_007099 [Polysphondylium violaceum]